MMRDKKRNIQMTAPKPKRSIQKQIKHRQKMNTVNKLDDIWEFEIFFLSIINSASNSSIWKLNEKVTIIRTYDHRVSCVCKENPIIQFVFCFIGETSRFVNAQATWLVSIALRCTRNKSWKSRMA